MMHKVVYSSKNMEWTTPDWLFERLDKEFHFSLDPACTKKSAKCKKFYTQKEDGLNQNWDKERVFLNPPYGREISKWVLKAYEESKKGAIVVCLIPSRTDTSYWHDYIFSYATEIRFIRGRVGFGKTKICPFPSAIVVFKKHKKQKISFIQGRLK